MIAIGFTAEKHRSIRRKTPICHKSLTNSFPYSVWVHLAMNGIQCHIIGDNRYWLYIGKCIVISNPAQMRCTIQHYAIKFVSDLIHHYVIKFVSDLIQHYVIKFVSDLIQHYVIKFVSDLIQHYVIKFVSDLIQRYMIKFVSDLLQVSDFLWFPPPIKLTVSI